MQISLDFDDDADRRVILLVHDTKPPFLEGKALTGRGADVVLPLKVGAGFGRRGMVQPGPLLL